MKWQKPPTLYYDGDQFIAAVRACSPDKTKEWWDYSIITVHVDENYFQITEANEPWGWGASDIEWLIPLKDLPVPGEQ
jgi:hypothetical protein